jgi:hypothetical protein
VSTKKQASKATGPAKNLSEKQIRRIWSEIKPLPLLDRLRALQPDGHWSASGSRIKGRCPYHDDGTPSFHIYLDRGYAKCFGCEKFIWNPVELWANVKGVSWSDALADLRQQFGIKFLSVSAGQQLKSWERNQLLKKRIAQICHDELISAIGSPSDPEYAYAQQAVKYLLQTRLIPKDALPTLTMLGVMPPIGRIMERLEAEAFEENRKLVEAAEESGEKPLKFTSLAEDARNYLDLAKGWLGAVCFRLDVAPDAIGRFKLRRPDTKDLLFLPDAYEEELGLLGLGWSLYKPMFGALQKYVPGVHVVEGEFDALSVMARMVLAGGPTFILVSAGGSSGGPMLDSLGALGVEELYLVGDEEGPGKNGEALIKAWLPHVRNLRARIFIGHAQFPGCGDPDEIVCNNGLVPFQAAMLKVKDRTVFQPPQEWVYDQAHPELDAVDSSDLSLRVEIAVEWGKLLKNGAECDAFVDACAKGFGLPQATVKRQIVAQEEDEPAFIMRLVNVLTQIFVVMGQRSSDGDRTIYLWHKEKRRIVSVTLADETSIERQLGPILGALYQFIHERVGIPRCLDVSDTQKQGQYLQRMDSSIRWYMRQALIIMAHDAPDFSTAEQRASGIHVITDKNSTVPTLYFVNGRDVFHGAYDAQGKLSWEQLPGPTHNGIIFDVGIRQPEKEWAPWISSTDDLKRADALDPVDVYNRLHALVSSGWRYKNHDITSQFLTSHLIATTVCDAFRRKVAVAFHADTRAGKSKMVMGLIGGTDFSRIHVMASAIGMPNFTPAGIKQRMNNVSRPLCLDEFEDEGSGDKKSRTVTESYELFRSLLGENNAVLQGSRSGEYVNFRLVFNLFVASINRARKSQDANRMVTVYMERVDNRPDPVQILLQEYGSTYIEQLKHDLSIALLPHIAKLQQAYAEIEVEFSKPGARPSTIDSRIFEGLYQALSVMKVLGLDYKTFASEFCEANKEVLTVAASQTDTMQVFDWLTQTACISTRLSSDGKDRHEANVLQMLSTPELRSEINISATGIFFDEPSQLLVVNWTMAIQRVFMAHGKWGRETNVFNLRELANRAPNAVKTEDLERSGALDRLRRQGLAGVASSHLTAYRMGHIIATLSAPEPFDSPPAVEGAKGEITEKKEKMDDADFG